MDKERTNNLEVIMEQSLEQIMDDFCREKGTSEVNVQRGHCDAIWKDPSYFGSLQRLRVQMRDAPDEEPEVDLGKPLQMPILFQHANTRNFIIDHQLTIRPLDKMGLCSNKKDEDERGIVIKISMGYKQKEYGIFINQDKYVAEILKKFNYIDVKSASTPVDLEKPLVKDGDADDVDVHLYRSTIGSLMYLTTSRPDIMFVVCACARFQVTPKTSHLLVVKRIFRFLKGKPTLGLWFSRDSPFELVVYTDSDYAGATQDRKSTTRDYLLTKGFDAERESKRGRDTKIPQCSGPPIKVGDEAVHKELGDRMERAATTASSLEAK
ncbi:hypothetical protein Tco_0223296 [Tanacetum coccineum]